jgi:4-aminobutyrate aminotransferase-like enzyme
VMTRLQRWKDEIDEVGDVRGLGLMIGIEMMRGDNPAADVAHNVQRRCVERDLLILTCGIDDNVIRLLPPLTITEDELDKGLDILEECLHAEVGR